MVYASRFIAVLTGGCSFCLNISNCQSKAVPAHDNACTAHAKKIDASDRRTDAESIKGEVRYVEGES